MTIPLARDNIRWRQLVDNPSAECRRLATSSYINANPFPASVSAPVEIFQAKNTDGHVIGVPDNRLRECIWLMSVFTYFDRFPQLFDVSRFRHVMRISRHLREIRMGGETRLACAGGCPKLWLYWGGQKSAVY